MCKLFSLFDRLSANIILTQPDIKKEQYNENQQNRTHPNFVSFNETVCDVWIFRDEH
jgi:hypothetical protein